MTRANNYIDFKLKDPFATHTSVKVAGTFNNWDPTANALSFDTESKDWGAAVAVDLPVDHKVLYKYVVDENKWICDVAAPLEKDVAGNENNVTFVIVKSKPAAAAAAAAVEKPQHQEEASGGGATAEATKQPDEQEEEVFDHKSFHENELFDASEQAHDETAPTSGEENNQDAESPTTEVAARKEKEKDGSIPKPEGDFTFASLWESIAWFFKYYILSWFYPEH